MTIEHLQPLLDHTKDARMFFQVAERLARAQVPPSVRDTVRLGRLTALQKPDGGVRGIVAGDVVRRLVARTMSQQLMEAVQGATAPFQYALATRAGCECVAHALQEITELNPRATVTSIDGISAFDLISRRAMMQGLHDVDHTAVPFVSMFYGTPSRYLWEDDAGTTHTIVQGEGGEQGDAMMPLLFALGQHPALEAVQRHLADGEFIFAYLDDIYFVTVPERTGIVYSFLQNALRNMAGIRIHQGKTKVWNNAREQPAACEVLDRMARAADPSVTTSVWRGSDVPVSQQGMKVLGTPLGHLAFVRAHLERTSREHQTLLDRIPMVSDLQSSWLLLVHCGVCAS